MREPRVMDIVVKTLLEMQNKYLIDNAKPGSWRRGYESHQKGVVIESALEKNEYRALVKGNFKDAYETELIFEKDDIQTALQLTLQRFIIDLKFIAEPAIIHIQ